VAFLVTLTTRLCLDRLRALKHERGHYVGPWLPEPIVEDEFPSPERQLELTGEVSVAFLTLLERLGPEERAAFLLHDVFDYDYSEVAKMIGKSEQTCRQIVHRARARVRESRPRFSATAETRERVLGKFLVAVKSGDRHAVMALLAEDAQYMADGGGKVIAALRILRGSERLGWLYHCVSSPFFRCALSPDPSQRRTRCRCHHERRSILDRRVRDRRRTHLSHLQHTQPR